jgi:phytoene dehydrogenase-like protein
VADDDRTIDFQDSEHPRPVAVGAPVGVSYDYDVVIVGGGHNALVAAAYLGRAGKSVLVLERLSQVGGAAVSTEAFAGMDAKLSRYSYLVSLLPPRIIEDLGLHLTLAPRTIASYTPDPASGGRTGLLIATDDAARTSTSFARIGAAADAEQFALFSEHCRVLTEALWPTMLDPLPTRSEAHARVVATGDERAQRVWDAMIDEPIGAVIERNHASDLVRGVLFTDALIGTFSGPYDEDLEQNRCFLYHLIGQGDGRWDVPVGGMGAVTGELALAARREGAAIRTDAEVVAVTPDGRVRFVEGEHLEEHAVTGRWILSGVARSTLDELVEAAGFDATPSTTGSNAPLPSAATAAHSTNPGGHPREGSQVKVNLLLSRLPRLKDPEVSPEEAFAGTFHINETWSQLEDARQEALAGRIPSPLPCEIYCHTLTDPSILSEELSASGAHTLTVFGLHVPDHLLDGMDEGEARATLTRAVLESLDSVLAEPIEDVIMRDPSGALCIETKTTRDLERILGLPKGNIFHGGLDWPFLEDDAPRDTPARRWGVDTSHGRILVCGSGARRGGAVSGFGGHNAAMAVIEADSASN